MQITLIIISLTLISTLNCMQNPPFMHQVSENRNVCALIGDDDIQEHHFKLPLKNGFGSMLHIRYKNNNRLLYARSFNKKEDIIPKVEEFFMPHPYLRTRIQAVHAVLVTPLPATEIEEIAAQQILRTMIQLFSKHLHAHQQPDHSKTIVTYQPYYNGNKLECVLNSKNAFYELTTHHAKMAEPITLRYNFSVFP